VTLTPSARRRSLAALLAFLLLPVGALSASECGDDPAVQAMEKAVKADDHNAINNYNLAVAYYQKQCFDQAIDAFERTLKLLKGGGESQDDMRADCEGILGALYYQVRQDNDDAIKHFKACLALRPGDKDSLNGISMAYNKAGKPDAAAEYLQQAIAADPHNVEARYRMATIQNDKLEAAGKKATAAMRDKVQAAFEQVVRIGDPDHDSKPADDVKDLLDQSYTRLGELYRAGGQNQKAVEALNRAIAIAPDDINSRFILGQVYFDLKDYASMIVQYQKVVDLDPKQEKARFNLGVAYINQEQFFEAWQQFKAISELDPSDSEALGLMGQELENAVNQKLALGTARYTAEDYGEAKTAFEAVLTMDPKNKQAKEYLEKVDEQVNKSYQSLVAQAKAALKSHKKEEAVEALEKALALKPDDPEATSMKNAIHADISKLVKAYLAKGENAFKNKDYENAESYWTKAQGFNAGKAKATANLARLHKLTGAQISASLKTARLALKNKGYEKARKAFEAALAVDKENAEANNGLAQVNTIISDKTKLHMAKGHKAMDSGDKATAMAEFNAVVKLDPTNADANSMIHKLTGSDSRAKVDAEKAKTLYYQGVDLYVNNKIKEAVNTWKEVLKIDPDNTDAQKNIQRAEAKLKALANL
jgi:tetratricopeptide (TPR) repeat protein